MQKSVRLGFIIVCLLMGISLVSAQEGSEIFGESDGTVITAETARDVEALARFGRGVPEVVAWSPDDSQIIVGGAAGVWAYDLADMNAPLSPLTRHSNIVNTIEYSDDGTRLITGDRAGGAIVWDAETFDVVTVFDAGGFSSTYPTFSPDGSTFAAVTSRDISIVDTQSGDVLVEIEPERSNGRIQALEFLDNETLLIGYSSTGNMEIWDVISNSLVRVIEMDGNGTLEHVLMDGVLIALDTREGYRVVEFESGELLYEVTEDLRSPRELVVSPDGSIVGVAISSNELRFYTLEDGELLTVFEDRLRRRSDYVIDMAFSSDGSVLVTMMGDMSIDVWATESLLSAEVPADETSIPLVELRGDSSFVLATSKFHTEFMNDAIITPDNAQVIAADGIDRLHVWSTDDGSEIAELADSVSTSGTGDNLMVIASDGSFYATRDSSTLRIFDPETHEIVHEVRAGTTIRDFVVTDDNSLIITANTNGTLEFWNPVEGNRLAQFDVTALAIRSLTLSADNTLLVMSSEDGTVHIWGITGE